MLTIGGIEERGIVLTEQEQQDIFPIEPFAVIRRKKPRQICQLCGTKTFTLMEYNHLELCVPCCNGFIKEDTEKKIRASPIPKSYSTLKESEYFTICEVLRRGMNITDSAAALGVTRATLYSKIKEHGIERN